MRTRSWHSRPAKGRYYLKLHPPLHLLCEWRRRDSCQPTRYVLLIIQYYSYFSVLWHFFFHFFVAFSQFLFKFMSESALNNYDHVVSELYLNNSKTSTRLIAEHTTARSNRWGVDTRDLQKEDTTWNTTHLFICYVSGEEETAANQPGMCYWLFNITLLFQCCGIFFFIFFVAFFQFLFKFMSESALNNCNHVRSSRIIFKIMLKLPHV